MTTPDARLIRWIQRRRHPRAQRPDHGRQHDPPRRRPEQDAERRRAPRRRSLRSSRRARRTAPRTTGSSSGSPGSGRGSRGTRRAEPPRRVGHRRRLGRVRRGSVRQASHSRKTPPTSPSTCRALTRTSVIAPSPNAAIAPYVASAVATPSPETRPYQPALGERPADDEQADRTDRGRDREAEDEAAERERGIHWVSFRVDGHRKTPSASVPGRHSCWWSAPVGARGVRSRWPGWAPAASAWRERSMSCRGAGWGTARPPCQRAEPATASTMTATTPAGRSRSASSSPRSSARCAGRSCST